MQSLLASRAAEILGIAATGGTTHREVAVMSEYVGADYHGRFLIELLQNANDQAGERGGTVTIIREAGLLAVANEGKQLDPDGVLSLTSLGMSSKDPNELIGNKGIGFKAVYEVSRSPEIYSAPHAGETFRAEGGFAFRISMDVFAGVDGQARLDALVCSARERKPEDARHLDDMPETSLAAELRAAAPFKFPIALTPADANARFASIDGLPDDAQTLVILPLDISGKAEVVMHAIDDLLAEGGVMILFLPGIARLRVIDRVRNLTTVIAKSRQELPSNQAGVRHAVITITVEQNGSAPPPADWQITESVYGGGSQPEQAARLNTAAKELPGSRYDDVKHVPVAVALRRPVAMITPEPHGFVCIGLPTKNPTGTPAWIHSHFFGSISRKDVKFEGCEFNVLLFDEALRLHQLLIERLRTSDEIEDRRLATLAFDCRAGYPLADALLAEGGQARGEIVLLDDGRRFARAETILIPRPEKFGLVAKIVSASAERPDKPALADEMLARHANELLRRLAAAGAAPDEALTMLVRHADGTSPVERAAERFRNDGPDFWEPFLTYCVALDPALVRLRALKVIPVGNDRTASAKDDVFLPPVQGQAEATEGENDEEELHSDLMETLPAAVAKRLNLVDVRCLRIRRPAGRKLTPLGEALSPADSGGLIRRPRLDELVNRAVIPALEALEAVEADLSVGLRLLKLAAELMRRMAEKSRERVSVEKLKVPAVSATPAGWRWVLAEECYFGEGWIDERRESQLRRLYGERDGAILLGWKAFAQVFEDADREEWRRVLETAGVNTRPRILSKSMKRFASPFHATPGQLQIREPARCPIDDAQTFWRPYLEHCRQRGTTVHTNQLYSFDRVTWIDGLDEEHAPLIVEMLLREPAHYEQDLTCVLGRDGTTQDSTKPPSLWVHALRIQDWPVIPTAGGFHRPSECWILRGSHGAARQRRFDLLQGVKQDHLHAARLLTAIGVEELERPSVEAILRELGRLARHANDDREGRTRQTERLVEDLYGRLQDIVAEREATPVPATGSVAVLPLLKEGRVVGVPVGEIKDAYCHDDPNRAEFVPGIAWRLRWPISTRAATAGFARWLRAWLGESAVLLTSEAAVETGFVAAGDAVPLLDWLREKFPAHQQVLTDLGCLIAYMGPRPTDPGKDQFRTHLARFQRAMLTFGRFARPGKRVFIDRRAHGQVDLYALAGLEPAELLGETWRLVAEAYEDVWRLYCMALAKGENQAAEFLRHKSITDKEREDVEASMGVASSERLDRLKAAAWAFRRAQLAETRDNFLAGWNANADTAAHLARWLGAPFTPVLLGDVLSESSDDDAFARLIHELGIGVDEWQQCREAIDQPRHRFQSAVELWADTRRQVCAVLQASFARLPGTELDAARAMIERLAAMDAPAPRVEAPPEFSAICAALLDAAERLEIEGSARSTEVARNRLQALRDAVAAGPGELRAGKEPPERDVREFREKAEAVRSREARERFSLYAEVARQLAQVLGETLDSAALAGAGNLPALIHGYWANRFSMAPIFQNELRKAAPLTLARMMERDAFRSDHTPTDLRSLFPEIASGGPGTIVKPPRRVALAGREMDEGEIERDIARGSAGSIGAALVAAAAAQDVGLLLLDGDRAELPATARREPGRSSGGGRRADAESDADKLLNGELGEMFVFEWLRARGFADFDSKWWLSTNRQRYTGFADGDNFAGCDFALDDPDGRLPHRPGRERCLIEVKSSAGDGLGTFKITEGEWQRATEAHFSSNEEYLIVRVAFVRTAQPRIVDILRDPYALMTQSKLRFVGGDFTALASPRRVTS